MSNVPAPPSPSGNGGMIPEYSSVSRCQPLARLSMVLGIIAVPTSIVLVGIPLGIAALVLGIIAQISIHRNPYQGGKAMASWGVTLGIITALMIPVVLALLMPSLGRTHCYGNRSSCSANLRGIMESMVLYAAEESTTGGGMFPVAKAPSVAGTYSITRQNLGQPTLTSGQLTASAALNDIPSGSIVQGSPTAGLFMLILGNKTSPKNFICKTDGMAIAPALLQAVGGGVYYEDFGATNISYAVAYPWTNDPKPQLGSWYRDNTDATFPVLCDMPPAQGSVINGKVVDATKASVAGTDPQSYNSPNHNGLGQNVAFGDVHVEFRINPLCGQSGTEGFDNIFTTSRFLGSPDPVGVGPSSGAAVHNPGTASPYDVQMVPARNSTGAEF